MLSSVGVLDVIDIFYFVATRIYIVDSEKGFFLIVVWSLI